MIWVASKILIASILIASASTVAEKKPAMAGFLIALPLSSILALLFTYLKTRDTEVTAKFGLAILTGVPLSLLFFVPFIFAERLKWSFACLYVSGFALLGAGYFIQQKLWS